MKTSTKIAFCSVVLFALSALATPAQAYYTQRYTTFPSQYGNSYGASSYRYSAPQQYSRGGYGGYNGYDEIDGLIQSHLNFVQQMVYIPAPIHQYFYQYYTPYYMW